MAKLIRLSMFFARCACICSLDSLSEELAKDGSVKVETLVGATLWTGIGTVSIGTLVAPYLASNWSVLMVVSTLAGPGAAILAELLFVDLCAGISFILLLWSSRREDR